MSHRAVEPTLGRLLAGAEFRHQFFAECELEKLLMTLGRSEPAVSPLWLGTLKVGDSNGKGGLGCWST